MIHCLDNNFPFYTDRTPTIQWFTVWITSHCILIRHQLFTVWITTSHSILIRHQPFRPLHLFLPFSFRKWIVTTWLTLFMYPDLLRSKSAVIYVVFASPSATSFPLTAMNKAVHQRFVPTDGQMSHWATLLLLPWKASRCEAWVNEFASTTKL